MIDWLFSFNLLTVIDLINQIKIHLHSISIGSGCGFGHSKINELTSYYTSTLS